MTPFAAGMRTEEVILFERIYAAKARLARAYFEKEEALLPEGESWDELTESEQSLYEECIDAVISELHRVIRGDATEPSGQPLTSTP